MKTSIVVAAMALSGACAHLINVGHHDRFVRALPTGEAAYANMKSEKQQCKYYNAPEIETMTKNNRLPKVSHVANILEGDDEANQIWNDIKNSGIIPKGINPKADTSGG